MARKKGRKDVAPVFKAYDREQMLLLPPSLDEMMPANHLVRTVIEMMNRLNISMLLSTYKGGGTSGCHPLMMVKATTVPYNYGYRKNAINYLS